MEAPKTRFQAKYVVIFLLIFFCDITVGDYQGEERDALYDLKAAFNNSFLNKNWNGLMCYMNNPNTTWYGISCKDGRVTEISLEGLGLSGRVPTHVLFNLTQLTLLNFRSNFIFGALIDFSNNRNLTCIDLSNNSFNGPISPSLVGLDSLVSLQLQDNFLSGPIPSFNQPSLREFNVSTNNLSGEIPPTSVLQSFSESSYSGNPELCGPPTPRHCPPIARIEPLLQPSIRIKPPPPPLPSNEKKPKKRRGSSLLVILVVLGAFALALVILLFLFYYKKARSDKEEETVDVQLEDTQVEERKTEVMAENSETRVSAVEEKGNISFIGEVGGFELSNLLEASAELLGNGSFGSSYKATFDDDRPAVVVKRMRDLNSLTGEQFDNHMNILARLKHPNLLPLLAYHHSKYEQLLIYRFMPNGNLFNRIHGNKGKYRIPFKWNSRLSVAKGVARALAFLHVNSNEHNPIPHGNLRSSNVLLDESEEALVSDYGLVPLVAGSVAVQQLVAYKSPEYQEQRRVSKKSDVWSFGCLLLELLTGRVSNHSAPPGVDSSDLSNWAHRAVGEEWTSEIFDLEIYVQVNCLNGMLKLLQIALKCCNKLPEDRPDMAEVLREIEDIRICDAEDDGEISDLSFSVSTGGSVISGDHESTNTKPTRLE